MRQKKVFLSMLAMSGILFATSCSQDELGNGSMGNTVEAKFTIKTPEGISTRAAIGDGTTVNWVKCVVYDEAGNKMDLDQTIALIDKAAEYNIRLVKGQNYRVAFFAYCGDENGESTAYDVSNMKEITIKDNQLSNVEARDAFTAYTSIIERETMEAIKREVTLCRPFAQLNIGSSDADHIAADKAGVVVTETQIKVSNVYTTFSAYDDAVVGEPTERTFNMNEIPTEDLLADADGDGENEKYHYLAMNYLLVGDKDSEKALTDVEFVWNAESGKTNNPTTVFSNIPVQRNYRTNILGYILTNPAEFDIVIDEEFKNDYNKEITDASVWDGKTVTEFTQEQLAAEVIEVKSAADLAGIAQLSVSGNNFAGKTIELKTNIDLAGQIWTPIAPNGKQFAGTFDGGNHTITGLKVEGNYNGVGFIGQTAKGAVVKDVHIVGCDVTSTNPYVGGLLGWNRGTVENCSMSAQKPVKVYGLYYVAALVGQNEQGCGLVKNCEVNGAIKIEAAEDAAGGLIGYNIGHIENCKVINEDTEKAEITAPNSLVGGLAGYGLSKGQPTIKGCTVEGNIELRGQTEVGGITGYFAGPELSNCTVKGVTIYADKNGGGLIGRVKGKDNNTVVKDCQVSDVVLKTFTENFEGGDGTVNPFIGKPVDTTLSGNTVDGVAVQ